MIISVEAGQQVVATGLCLSGVPRGSSALSSGGLAGLDDQLASVDVGLQDVHLAIVEQNGVSIVGRTSEDFHGVGLGGVVQIQCVTDVLALHLSQAEVVTGDVVVNSLGVLDSAVVSDDQDTSFLSLFTGLGQREGVNCCDDQAVNALGDHVLDLSSLTSGVVFSELNQNFETSSGQSLLQAVCLHGPNGLLLGGHTQTDLSDLAVISLSTGLCATSNQADYHNESQQDSN